MRRTTKQINRARSSTDVWVFSDAHNLFYEFKHKKRVELDWSSQRSKFGECFDKISVVELTFV